MEFLKEKLNLRLYQQTILNQTIQKNTLVVLPTGLGKTYIAVALAGLRLKEGSKVLFLAPTKPLIVQHKETFSKFLKPESELAVLSGEVQPDKRQEIWQNASIIFSTPQTIKSDIISGKINLANVCLVIFDEAHRAVGDYDYVFLAKTYVQQALDARVLALTASPGADEVKIQDVCRNLFIEAIEARSRDHEEVKDYVKEILVDYIFVELPEEIKTIKQHIELAIKDRLVALKNLGFIQTNDISKITKKSLLALQTSLQPKIIEHKYEVGRAISLCAGLIKLLHALSLLESESLSALNEYFNSIWQKSKISKIRAVKDIVSDFHIRVAYSLVQKALENGLEHPKLEALQKIVQQQLGHTPNSKILIFTDFRSNIKKILESVDEVSGVNAHKFIGQANRLDAGMNQKTQSEIIERFKSGDINCLIATAVAEEGLDIPSVDLVVFYAPVPSAIRTIQRRGRTGRQEVGKLAVMITKGTRDEAFYWISRHKEQKMNSAINTIKTHGSGLQQYIKTEKELPEEKIIIFADMREHGEVTDYLFEQGVNVKISTLKAGDFILSEDVGVERKIVKDFVVSLIDGRLFEQAKNLKENFSKPLYIVEGQLEELFKARDVHPNALWSALASLVLDWQIPILFSSSPMETANLLAVIAKREQLERKKDISLRGSNKPHSLPEMQEFFIEGLPTVGPSLAKALLRKFRTPKKIANATLEQLKKVEKIGDKKAELIRRILDEEYKPTQKD